MAARVDGRRRGNHSTRCINLKPVYVRSKNFKRLPGLLHLAFKNACDRDVSKHPLFVQLREVAGRERGFRPEAQYLLNALMPLLVSRHDLLTKTVNLNIEQMAEELSKKWVVDTETGEDQLVDCKVTVSRVSRIINNVLIAYGLATAPRGMIWDKKHGLWFPKVLELTDSFYKVLGINLEDLERQIEKRLHLMNQDITNPDEVLTIAKLRKIKHAAILKRSWELRLKNSNASKKKTKLAQMTVEERKHEVAKMLAKQKTADELALMTAEAFEKEVWAVLNKLECGVVHMPPERPQ